MLLQFNVKSNCLLACLETNNSMVSARILSGGQGDEANSDICLLYIYKGTCVQTAWLAWMTRLSLTTLKTSLHFSNAPIRKSGLSIFLEGNAWVANKWKSKIDSPVSLPITFPPAVTPSKYNGSVLLGFTGDQMQKRRKVTVLFSNSADENILAAWDEGIRKATQIASVRQKCRDNVFLCTWPLQHLSRSAILLV